MSLFNLLAGDPAPVQLNQGLGDQLFNMPTQAASAPEQAPMHMSDLHDVPNVPDLWKPTHRNILGRLADAMLIGHGQKPVYEARMQERDMASAMEGFDPNNPIPTIKRIAQIPGMADQAYKMYEQYSTDQERNQSRDIRDAAKQDMVWNRLGAMAGAATEKNFPVMKKLMTDYVTRWGLDPKNFDIPDTYDPDALDAMSNGAISAKDQQAQQTREDALALRGRAVDSIDAYRQARLGQFGQQEADRQDRFNRGEAGKNSRHDNPVARPATIKPTAKPTMTKYGPALVSPDGNQMIVTNPKMGGRQFGYVKVGNNWVPVGETARSKKEHE